MAIVNSQIYIFLKKMAIKWWKWKFSYFFFYIIIFFYVYQIVSTWQTVCFYPRNCSFWSPMGLFEKTAPKYIINNILSQHIYFSFSLGHFQYTCWILWLLNCVFWGDMNRELLPFLTFPYTRNANQRHFIILIYGA